MSKFSKSFSAPLILFFFRPLNSLFDSDKDTPLSIWDPMESFHGNILDALKKKLLETLSEKGVTTEMVTNRVRCFLTF